MITGWVLGKGPCGVNCKSTDVGRSTKTTRNHTIEAHDDRWLGSFYAEYKINNVSMTPDVTNTILSNYTAKVLAVSESAKWEQEILKSTFEMLNGQGDFDIK